MTFKTPYKQSQATMDRLHGMLVFLRVVEHGSLSAAARALGVSTSAVSTTLTRLERQLAVRLLNRTTRRISVTPEGGEFYARCKRITDDLAEAELVVGQAGRLPSGNLRVRLPLTLGRMWIVPNIRRFTDAYPSIALEVVCKDVVPPTIAEGLDVQVQTGEVRDSRVAVRRLATTEYATCAAPQVPVRARYLPERRRAARPHVHRVSPAPHGKASRMALPERVRRTRRCRRRDRRSSTASSC